MSAVCRSASFISGGRLIHVKQNDAQLRGYKAPLCDQQESKSGTRLAFGIFLNRVHIFSLCPFSQANDPGLFFHLNL